MPVDGPAQRDSGTLPPPATPAMNLDEIAGVADRLMAMMHRREVSRLVLSVGTVQWEIEANPRAAGPVSTDAAQPRPAERIEAAGPAEPSGYPVVAPVVGVLYAAPQPGAVPFVTVGQRVEAGQQVAIIEAMKMMNEVITDRAGVVREIHVSDGSVVEFGQRLLSMDPV